MKQEKGIWRVAEFTLSLHVPLSDPDYLKGFQKKQDRQSESSAVACVRTIATAEVTYATAYPQRGFTCRLADLGGSEIGAEPAEDHAMLIDPLLAGGEKSGYVFTISGCTTAPADKYQITAVPADPGSGMRAFCEDQSGVIRASRDGDAAECVNSGEELQ